MTWKGGGVQGAYIRWHQNQRLKEASEPLNLLKIVRKGYLWYTKVHIFIKWKIMYVIKKLLYTNTQYHSKEFCSKRLCILLIYVLLYLEGTQMFSNFTYKLASV